MWSTVATVSSGTTKKCLLNQYEWMDSESGNKRLKSGHQRRDRDLWILIWSHIEDTAASSLTEIWSKNLVVTKPWISYWIIIQIEHLGGVPKSSGNVDSETVFVFQNWSWFHGEIIV